MIHRARIYRGPAKNTPTARNSKSSSLGMNKCWRSVFDNFFPLFHGLTVDSALLQPWLRLFLGAIGDLVKCCWMVVILSQKLLLCCTCKPDVTLWAVQTRHNPNPKPDHECPALFPPFTLQVRSQHCALSAVPCLHWRRNTAHRGRASVALHLTVGVLPACVCT